MTNIFKIILLTLILFVCSFDSFCQDEYNITSGVLILNSKFELKDYYFKPIHKSTLYDIKTTQYNDDPSDLSDLIEYQVNESYWRLVDFLNYCLEYKICKIYIYGFMGDYDESDLDSLNMNEDFWKMLSKCQDPIFQFYDNGEPSTIKDYLIKKRNIALRKD